MALAPPDSPVPAPRVTTGTRSAAQARTAARTSSVEAARRAARGLPASAHSASSALSAASTSGSVIRLLSGSAAVSASRTPAVVMASSFTFSATHALPRPAAR